MSRTVPIQARAQAGMQIAQDTRTHQTIAQSACCSHVKESLCRRMGIFRQKNNRYVGQSYSGSRVYTLSRQVTAGAQRPTYVATHVTIDVANFHLWATVMVVRPPTRLSKAAWTTRSDLLSSAEVASSSNRICERCRGGRVPVTGMKAWGTWVCRITWSAAWRANLAVSHHFCASRVHGWRHVAWCTMGLMHPGCDPWTVNGYGICSFSPSTNMHPGSDPCVDTRIA